jgi:hypothetical protein
MIKPGNPNRIRLIAKLETQDIQSIRAFYGAALKLRHPQHLQDLQAPPVILWGKCYDTDIAVVAYREGFEQLTRYIIEAGQPQDYFRSLSLFLSGCCRWHSNKRIKSLTLSRKFARARREMRKLFTELNANRNNNGLQRLDKKTYRGLTPFTTAAKKQLRQYF